MKKKLACGWKLGNLYYCCWCDYCCIYIDNVDGLCGDDDDYDLLARRELVVVYDRPDRYLALLHALSWGAPGQGG